MLFALHGTTYAETVLSIDPAEIESPAAGESLTVSVNITGGTGIKGYGIDVMFDPTALSFVGVQVGDFLPGAIIPVAPTAATDANTGLATVSIAGVSFSGEGSDMGTVVTLSFNVVEAKDSSIQLANIQIPDPVDASLQTLLAVTTADGAITVPAPEMPETPETPEMPETPETPEMPETPETPEMPETPETPEMPETPETPEMPVEPAPAPPIKADQTFTVTLENLTVGTPAESGQIFSPALFIAHTSAVKFVEAGTASSDELRAIAETGDNAPLSALAMATEGVKAVQSAEGVLLPGASTSVMIDGGADGWLLSFASMLVQTNDGLVAGNSLSLFDEAGAPRTFTMDIMAYDAGTEENNELATHVPGPPFGGSEQAAEGGVIAAHPGIGGNADVGSEFGWTEPVARLSVAPYVEPPARPTRRSRPFNDA